jgi:hypothetical protein
MRLVTSLIALALAIGAVVVPGVITGSARAADSPAAVLSFAPASSGVLAPGQDLVISGTIANPTTTPIAAGTATIVLNRPVVTSRSSLASWLKPATTSANDSLGTRVLDAPTPEVPAGRTVPLEFTVPAASINFGPSAQTWGARTLAVRVSAAGSEVGQARSSIVWNPGTPVQPTRLGLVMPLTVPASADGLVAGDLLATYTGQGGLLSRQLDAVFDQPGVAIGIDPRVLASIRILGDSAPASAVAWLKRLEAATNGTFALSYADSDLAAASQAKATRLLAPTSFPVDASLFPGAPTSTPTDQPTGTPTPTPSASPEPAPIPDLASLQAFDYTLPSVAWPADDSVVEGDLDSFETGGLKTAILSSGNVGYGDLDYTPSSAALIGKHRVLVSDSVLSGYLRAAVSAPTPAAWQSAMASLSSAIAVVSLERPAATRTLLATLDRTNPGGDVRLAQTIGALGALPWAESASLGEADAAFGSGSAVLPTIATLASRPEPAERVATVAKLLTAENTADSFSSVLTDPTQITGERRLTLLALLANSWAGDSGWDAATGKYIAKSNQYATKSVTIARSGATLITSRTSGLPITVTNALPWPVTVYVTVRSPSTILTVDSDRVELTIEAQSQSKTTVPVTSNANGPVTLTVALSSATNVPIALPTAIEVDVQAGWETAFTAVVALALLGVFGFGIYRTVAKRRKAKSAPGEPAVAEDAAEEPTPATAAAPEKPGP